MTEGKYLLTGQPCKCGSSDAKVYYVDGGSKCFSCGVSKVHDTPESTGAQPKVSKTVKHKTSLSLGDVKNLPSADINARGISNPIVDMFDVKQSFDPETREPDTWYFPYYEGGEVVGYKARKVKDKEFFSIGKIGLKSEPFGWNRVSAHGKLLIITEGELDAMAATEMLKSKGKDYKVVSIANGAQSAASFVKANLEKLEHFEKIILNFDSDEYGRDAQKECAALLTPGQAYMMKLPDGFKDANDLLLGGKAYQYLDAINQAKEFRPDGIIAGVDTWDLYVNRPEIKSYPFPEDWVEMNRMTYGIRIGELDTFTSGTSAGKTQLMREIMFHLMNTVDHPLGIISLEEPLTDTIESYMELHLNRRISLPDVEATEKEKFEAWEHTVGNGKTYLYDAFGGDEDSVISKIRFFAKGLGVKFILVDHLHMLLDGLKGDEREKIDRIMLRLKKLTQELDVWIGLVAHLRKSEGSTTFEEGAIANLDDLKGSSTIKQLSNGVYVLSRDQQAEDTLTRNTTQLTVKKCRFTGRTGLADKLLFNDETGRMTVLKSDDLPY